MLTVTTLPNGSAPRGFTLFIDGASVASLTAATATASGPPRANATGGTPASLTSNINLCGRYDGDPSRWDGLA